MRYSQSDESDETKTVAIPGPEIPLVYFNSIRVTRTPYDFQIVFGQTFTHLSSSDWETLVQGHFMAQTSPVHFKAMVRVLSKVLDDYEREYGKLPDPATKSD